MPVVNDVQVRGARVFLAELFSDCFRRTLVAFGGCKWWIIRNRVCGCGAVRCGFRLIRVRRRWLGRLVFRGFVLGRQSSGVALLLRSLGDLLQALRRALRQSHFLIGSDQPRHCAHWRLLNLAGIRVLGVRLHVQLVNAWFRKGPAEVSVITHRVAELSDVIPGGEDTSDLRVTYRSKECLHLSGTFKVH